MQKAGILSTQMPKLSPSSCKEPDAMGYVAFVRHTHKTQKAISKVTHVGNLRAANRCGDSMTPSKIIT